MKHMERVFQQFPGSLREKCPNTELFSGRYSPSTGKYGPEKLRILTVYRHWIFRTSAIMRILNHQQNLKFREQKKHLKHYPRYCQLLFVKTELLLNSSEIF